MINEILNSLLTFVNGEEYTFPKDEQLIAIFKGHTDDLLKLDYNIVSNALDSVAGDNLELREFLKDCIKFGVELTRKKEDLSSYFTTSFSSDALNYSKNNSTKSKVQHSHYMYPIKSCE